MEPKFDPEGPRLGALDELRGLAIIAVLASHIGLVFGPDLAAAKVLAAPALGVGVDLFFVISGFVIAENARRMRIEARGAFWRGASAFWIRRILRIGLPAWVTVIAIGALEAGGAPLGATSADLKAAAGFYANFHWAPCFTGAAGCGALLAASHFWSLANEMQFYLAAPFLMALRPIWTALICLTILAAGAFCDRPWGGFWWTFRLDGLAVGVLLSLGATRQWRLRQIGVGMASFWIVVASILTRICGVLGSGFVAALVAMIFGFVVASAIEPKAPPLKPGALQKIGEMSFSIYLVHLPIFAGVHDVLLGAAPPVAILLLATGAVFVSALLLDRWIATPARIFGRRISERICRDAVREHQPVGAS